MYSCTTSIGIIAQSNFNSYYSFFFIDYTMRFFSILRRKYISILFLFFTLFLLVFANSNLVAAKTGLKLWASNVVPSLFPFFVAANLLSYSSIPYYLSKYCNKFMKPLFNLPGISSFPFVMGLISGCPVGAKITCDLYKNTIISKSEAERMLCFTNNCSPLFIIGTVGISFYSSTELGLCLLACHILSAITVGIIFGNSNKFQNLFMSLNFKSTKKSSNSNEFNIGKDYIKKLNHDIGLTGIGSALSDSIFNAIKSVLIVGGFVTIFSVIISIFQNLHLLDSISSIIGNIFDINKTLVNGLLTGVLEFTNGLNLVSKVNIKNISVNLIISSFLLGFGGLSVFFQVVGIAHESHVSTKKYLCAKFLQGIIAAFYTFLLLSTPFFNFNL